MEKYVHKTKYNSNSDNFNQNQGVNKNVQTIINKIKNNNFTVRADKRNIITI
mgnify:CR=1 FL=1